MSATPPTLLRPASATDVTGLLRDGRAICGGTDLLVQWRAGAPVAAMIDLTAIRASIPVLEETAAGDLRISALHPLTEVTSALGEELVPLRESVAVFASTTIRNRATLGGNLANGSPAADTVPPLLVLGAVIDVVTPDGGTRAVPLADFLLGPGRVQLDEQEWIRTVTIPASARGCGRPGGGFRKIGGRAAQAISFLSLAWQWRVAADGTLTDVRLAMGAVAPTVVRLTAVENLLEGSLPGPDLIDAAAAAVDEDIRPIDDLRASAAYRRRCAAGLVREALGAPAHHATRDER
ncbi:FAD binding domain-containing protein [Pseudactinotalea suaedae]|uniref:FAD binding domain-containing protein n=1 Tax=Pseudactinotalea suaedae TaxID=1524924 RepID=UPI0012E211F6|nr:FAD binding domain-containing protein [Pseudactinotalea suaedae]